MQLAVKFRIECFPENVVESQVSYCRISGGPLCIFGRHNTELKTEIMTETNCSHDDISITDSLHDLFLVPCTLSASVETETTCYFFVARCRARRELILLTAPC
jgi:hypothetical protein